MSASIGLMEIRAERRQTLDLGSSFDRFSGNL